MTEGRGGRTGNGPFAFLHHRVDGLHEVRVGFADLLDLCVRPYVIGK